MTTRHIAPALAITIAAISGLALPGARAADAVANAGTLTCVVAPGSDAPFGAERELSCTFEPLTGPKADLTGVVKRIGAESIGTTKVVLVWSVMAPTANPPVESLAGRYVGTIENQPATPGGAAGLIGGADQSIRLRPLTSDPALVGNAAISVLELELTAMKA